MRKTLKPHWDKPSDGISHKSIFLRSYKQEERLGINPLRHLPARIKECLNELEKTDKRTKTIDRTRHLACGWQNIKNGYYVGDQNEIAYYPFPSKDELDREHHNWWRSASM